MSDVWCETKGRCLYGTITLGLGLGVTPDTSLICIPGSQCWMAYTKSER